MVILFESPFEPSKSDICMRFSVSASRAAEASSRMSKSGLLSRARASAIRALCPPDNITPRSPTNVSMPSESRETKSHAPAVSSAFLISSSEASRA